MAKHKKSQSELDQLLQTVQMFEVIAETQPNDIQSLEILKEAYVDLDRDDQSLKISRQIAMAYVSIGQLSSAILEYEGILQKIPDDPECRAMLQELELKMGGISGGGVTPQETAAVKAAAQQVLDDAAQFEDGNEAMIRFFQENGVVTEKDASGLLAALTAATVESSKERPAPSLLNLMRERGICATEKSLGVIVEKTRLPFLPLGIYDVDPARVSLVDKAICLQHLVLPFDQISRTTLVATANPFDAQAKEHIESKIRGKIQWYLAHPDDMIVQLKSVFRIQG